MRQRRRRTVAAVAIVLGVLVTPSASAHVTVQPTASRPADLQFYSVTVPSERPVTTTGVDLKLPAGFNFVLADQTTGWKSTVVHTSGGDVSMIRWRGTGIEKDHYHTFRFIARNPVKEGPLTWKALQHYKDGTVVRWIGAAGTEFPASRTSLTEAAVPTDTASVNGEPLPAPVKAEAKAAAAAPAKVATAESGRDGLTLGIAIAAGLLALVALLLSAKRRSVA